MKKREIYLPPQIKDYSVGPYQVMGTSVQGEWDDPDHATVNDPFWQGPQM